MLRWHDRCGARLSAAPLHSKPCPMQPRRRLVTATVYRNYNDMMSQRTREYLHDGDEPIGDYLYDFGEEDEEDEEALLDAKLRLRSTLGNKLTITALQRAYTSCYLPPKFIGNVKLVNTKTKGWSIGTTERCQAQELLMCLPPLLDLSSSFWAAAGQPAASDVVRHLKKRPLEPQAAAVLQLLYYQPRAASQKPPELHSLLEDAAAAAALQQQEQAAEAEAAAGAAGQDKQRASGVVASGRASAQPRRQPLIAVAKKAADREQAAAGGAAAAAAGAGAGLSSIGGGSSLMLSSEKLRALVQQNLVRMPQDAALLRCRAAGQGPAEPAGDAACQDVEVLDYTAAGKQRQQQQRQRQQRQDPSDAEVSSSSSSSSSSGGRLLGFWPEHSFLNHSCLPNAVAVPLADRLLLRAVRDMSPEEEVAVSYLTPSEQLAGLEQRQQLLKERYGFVCRCPRCRLELSHQDSLGPELQALLAQLPELQQELQLMLRSGDLEQLLAADAQLQALAASYQAAMQAAGVEGAAAEVLKAPALELYQLISQVRAAMAPQAFRTLRSLADCVQIVSYAAPGTELHTQLAAELAYKVEQAYGLSSARSQDARALCFAAHRLRYGALDMGTMKQLVKASVQAAAEAGWR